MSATLVSNISGNGTKTGTAIANLLDDLDTLIATKSGDATFFWEKAGKSSAATPFWLLLRRKDGSAGRIALICYTSAPAATQPVLFDTAPTTNNLFISYFPSGTGTTLSNLTASSGTVCGNDTNATKAAVCGTVAALYGASFVPFYVDNAEYMQFGWQNPAAATTGMGMAGEILVDAADVAYGGAFGTPSWDGLSSVAAWSSTFPNAGSTTVALRTNYGAAGRAYFFAWSPTGPFTSSAVSSTDILSDSGANKRWFIPIQLLGQTKGEGFVIKLRQIGFGSGSLGAFDKLYTTGPTLKAMQFTNQTTGATGRAWVLNFKL